MATTVAPSAENGTATQEDLYNQMKELERQLKFLEV
jgi:hypothetical protein